MTRDVPALRTAVREMVTGVSARMTGTKWATAALVAIVAAGVCLATVTTHHPRGTASSLGQVLGWLLFAVLVLPTMVMLIRGADAAVQRRRYDKTYARLQREDLERST